MAYFLKRESGSERVGKVLADVFCALIILVFAVVYFGLLGGLLPTLLLVGAIIGLDFLMPNENDASGAAIR
jgi:hypothetical protein